VLTPSAIAGTIDAVGDLENLGSVRKLMDMLRAVISHQRSVIRTGKVANL